MGRFGNQSGRDQELLLTTPAVFVSYVASIVGTMIPLALTIAIVRGSGARKDTPLMLTILWAMMLAGFIWSAWSYRSVRSTSNGLLLVQGLPPLRRTCAIPFGAVRRVHITDYSYKLVLDLEGGSKVTIANIYTRTQMLLPAVELDPHEPGGAYKTLKELKAFIEAKLADNDLPSGDRGT